MRFLWPCCASLSTSKALVKRLQPLLRNRTEMPLPWWLELEFLCKNAFFVALLCLAVPWCPHQKHLSKDYTLYFPWLAPQREAENIFQFPYIYPTLNFTIYFHFFFYYFFLHVFFHILDIYDLEFYFLVFTFYFQFLFSY